MRLLLDECLPRQLKHALVGHDVTTVAEARLAGLENGALLNRAAQRFDAFITVDANLQFQQNLSKMPLRIVVLRAVSNDMSDLLPLVPALLQALERAEPGTVVEISER